VTELTTGDTCSRPTWPADTRAVKPLMIANRRPTWPPSCSTCRAAATMAPGWACTITETDPPPPAALAVPATGGSIASTTAASRPTVSHRIPLPPSAPNAPAPILSCSLGLAGAASSTSCSVDRAASHAPHRRYDVGQRR
jgi:hypothetical protein